MSVLAAAPDDEEYDDPDDDERNDPTNHAYDHPTLDRSRKNEKTGGGFTTGDSPGMTTVALDGACNRRLRCGRRTELLRLRLRISYVTQQPSEP
jgi:hypothetical protein